MTTDFVSNEEIVQRARKNLVQGAWDYLVGGSESETTMRRNRLAFDRVAFRPRVLVDVSEIDPSTTFLGHNLRIPVMLAPIGSLQVFTPGGAVDASKAAAEFGTMHVVSSVTEPALEETAAAAPNPKVFQLYVHGDWEWIEDIVARVKEAQYDAFCVTVDVAHYSRRERPMISRWVTPTRRRQTNPYFRAALDWEIVDRIRKLVDMPFMIKGIAASEDAEIAVQQGVDVIWISNHGGRQLDGELGTMDLLPEIVETVNGRAKIILDGGVQRGGDVLKALAMGVDAVAIGKLQGWGLAAGGQDGLVRVLEILEDELVSAMGLLGITSLDQLNSNYVRRAEPVILPHEMSAWTNMPGGRVL